MPSTFKSPVRKLVLELVTVNVSLSVVSPSTFNILFKSVIPSTVSLPVSEVIEELATSKFPLINE